MAEHTFLETGQIEEGDLFEILDLTATGQLEWGPVPHFAAIGSNVDYSMGPMISVNRNLLEVRAGFIPDQQQSFNYLKLTDMRGNEYCVEHDSGDRVLVVAKRVLRLGLLAVTTQGGRLAGAIQDCRDCERPTVHIALYDAAHGIPGAVMAGSERVECVCCGGTTNI